MPDSKPGDGLLGAAPQSEEWPEPRRDSPEDPGARVARSTRPGRSAARRSPGAQPAASRPRRAKLRHVFVVSAARSGSTLLRYLLDSHPEITAPPELNLSAYLQHTVSMWSRVEEAVGDLAAPDGPQAGPSEQACRKGRKALDEMTAAMAPDPAVSVFCDKSLTSVDALELLERCYPDGSFVFLHRYPLDMISSGIEASRWGFSAYGFAPFLGSAPGNFVAGLGNYWIDRATKMVEFEKACAEPHARIYYELLCGDPLATLQGLFQFLGVRHDARTVKAVIRKALQTEHATGPGDYKIDFTTQISRDSIGRGSLLPRLLAPQQIERIDQLLADLDYPSLEAAWGGDLAKLIGLRPAEGAPALETEAAAGEITAALSRGLRATSKRRSGIGDFLPLELVVTGPGGMQRLLVVTRRGVTDAGSPDAVDREDRLRLRCAGDSLLEVAAGRMNLAQLMQDGRVRAESGTTETRSGRAATRRALLGLSALLQAGATV